jgi:hypothetical protein
MVEKPSLVCLQETKLHIINDYNVMQILSSGFDYSYLPTNDTRGGILVTWHSATWTVLSTSSLAYSLSIRIAHHQTRQEWWLTTVYGPARDYDKPDWLDELHALRLIRTRAWLLTRDFILIYQAADKNNGNLNRRQMGQFRRFLSESALKELHLNGRLITWSNERDHPTLERIGRAFVLAEWDALHPNQDL